MGERHGRLEWVLKDGISRVERNVEAQKLGYAVLALGDGGEGMGGGDLIVEVEVVGRLLPSQRPLGESLYQARTRICQKYVGDPALWERVEAADGVPPQRPLGEMMDVLVGPLSVRPLGEKETLPRRPIGRRDVELEELYGGEAELYGGKGGEK